MGKIVDWCLNEKRPSGRLGRVWGGGLIRSFAGPQVRRRLAGAAGEDVEEVDDVLVFWEGVVVVEVDVVAGVAC